MKLRISNEIDAAVEFEAASISELKKNLEAALAEWHIRSIRNIPYLHVFNQERGEWINVGYGSGTTVYIYKNLFGNNFEFLWKRCEKAYSSIEKFNKFFQSGGELDDFLDLTPEGKRRNFKIINGGKSGS